MVGGRSNLPSNPTGSVVSRLIVDRQLQEYERIAKAVEHVYNLTTIGRSRFV
ncbi:MAG: hypothetical protein WAM95_19065 [Bacillus sp. (in: firmicutes)]